MSSSMLRPSAFPAAAAPPSSASRAARPFATTTPPRHNPLRQKAALALRTSVGAPRSTRPARLRVANSDDFITNLVGKLFGSKVVDDPEPAGLKRMTVEEWPDQWPATTDEWADAVQGDNEEVALIRPMLKQTRLERMPLGLAFDANVHGWSTNNFHQQLDGQGAAIIICQSSCGAVFGGYNPKGWLGYGDWRDAISAFLFTWLDGDMSQAPMKMAKVGGSGLAIIDEPGKGPQFGPDGLKINIENQQAMSRLGSYYDTRPDSGRSLFNEGMKKVDILECRIYVGLEETEKEKEYEPNALQWQPGELERIRAKDDSA